MLLLNYKPVLSQPTGIGVYANGVLPALQQFEHVLIAGGAAGSAQERLRRLAWSQFKLPRLARKLKADLIFSPAPEGYLGVQAVPQVVMVHDLRPLSHPERSMQSLYFKYWVPPLLSQCRHILTNSNFTASEIQRATGVSEEKISVTPLGYDSDHFCQMKEYRRLHHRPYFLNIGQAYPHKNLKRLIKAFSAIASRYPEVDLLLLGKSHSIESKRLEQLIIKLGISERVIFKCYVPYADLPHWYRGALALVYPSLWEGFGLPIIEAMACGCPVITSFGSGTEEVAGGNAILVDPTRTDEIQQALIEVLTIASMNLSAISKAGLQYVRRYSWQNTNYMTASLMTELIGALR